MAGQLEMTLSPGNGAPDLTSGSIFFVGTATVLVRFAGFTMLTDPNFIHMHERVPLGYGLRAMRRTNPAIDVHELPPLDIIVLSHFHRDHFDEVAERKLDKSLPIVTTPEASKELSEHGFICTVPLPRWSTFSATKGDIRLTITSTPGRHGPPLSNRVLPEVMGTIWEFQTSGGQMLFRMYVSGDTLVIDDLKEIPRRYPDIDLALLHLGGTVVLGITVTMDGKQGVEVIRMVNPRHAIPIHYNDYDVFKSPLADFQREVKEAGLEDRVHYLSHGETYTFKVPS